MKKYDEQEVVRSLNKRRDVQVRNLTIKVLASSDELGIGTWSKIDFLKAIGYSVVKVDTINNQKPERPKFTNEDREEKRRKKKDKFGIVNKMNKTMKF